MDLIFGFYDWLVSLKQSFRIRRELRQPYVFLVDLPRLAGHIVCLTMFSDFRETYSLRERKAHKVATLLSLLSFYYSALEKGLKGEDYGLPANTVLWLLGGNLIDFYALVEDACVQPPRTLDLEAEVGRHPNILEYVIEDLAEVFAGEIPWQELGSIGTLLKLPKLTAKRLSRREISNRRRLADEAWNSFAVELMTTRQCLRQAAYEVPHLRVLEVFGEVRKQVITLQDCPDLHQTELVQIVPWTSG